MKTIYCIKNERDKIIYIGQTVNYKRRCYEHRYRKHLPKEYYFEIIEECEDSIAKEREIYYINLYDTVEKGLNIVYQNGKYGIKTLNNQKDGFCGQFSKNNTVWKNRKLRKVRCIENEIIYESARDCGNALGIKDISKINNVCNGYRKSYHKYHFEYVE